MELIDLRSDTVTIPTEQMRKVISTAPVGDDVFGEDPTVNHLQEKAADLLGKETALLFPSGTMANQASLQLMTCAGDVVLAGEGAHVLRYESGAAAALSGLQIQTIGQGGLFSAQEFQDTLFPQDVHRAPVRVVAIENTHNWSGGRIFSLAEISKIAKIAKESDILLHLDGARLWNAVVATDIPASDWASPFDTVAFCLSKGLGAPVGSLVATSEEFQTELLRIRKRMGGGMRQAGLLAAAGLYALNHHVNRLSEDHDNATRLARGLRERDFSVEEEPETNIVVFRCEAGPTFQRAAQKRGVLLSSFTKDRFRAVTHLGISMLDIDQAIERVSRARDETVPLISKELPAQQHEVHPAD